MVPADGRIPVFDDDGQVIGTLTGVASGTEWRNRFYGRLSHMLALKDDGTVWAWGSNRFGQLGNGDGLYVDIPARVRNLTEVAAVAASASTSLALKTNGTVWEWGCESAFGIALDWNYPLCWRRPRNRTP